MLGVIFTIVALVLALAATVLAFIFIVPEKKAAGFNKFLKFVHDLLNFKFFFIEKIVQALYIFSTAYVALFGFLQLFNFSTRLTYYGLPTIQWHGGSGFLYLILGPVVVRVVYELSMLFLSLVRNVIELNKTAKAINGKLPGGTTNQAPANQPAAQPQQDSFNPSFMNFNK